MVLPEKVCEFLCSSSLLSGYPNKKGRIAARMCKVRL